jgi:hypothetical protein
VLILAVLAAGCLPANVRPTPSGAPATPAPTPLAGICVRVAGILDERDALARAFLLAASGRAEDAAAAANASRPRLEGLVLATDGAPTPPPEEQDLASGIFRLTLSLMMVSAILDEEVTPVTDPEQRVTDGVRGLGIVDDVLASPGWTSEVDGACPGLALGRPVVPLPSLPPAPSNAELGIPDSANGHALEAVVIPLGTGYGTGLQGLGVDTAAVRAVRVTILTGGDAEMSFLVLDGVDADPAKVARALSVDWTAMGARAKTRKLAGFTVTTFSSDGDPGPLQIAQRGDRVVRFLGLDATVVDGILAAMASLRADAAMGSAIGFGAHQP